MDAAVYKFRVENFGFYGLNKFKNFWQGIHLPPTFELKLTGDEDADRERRDHFFFDLLYPFPVDVAIFTVNYDNSVSIYMSQVIPRLWGDESEFKYKEVPDEIRGLTASEMRQEYLSSPEEILELFFNGDPDDEDETEAFLTEIFTDQVVKSAVKRVFYSKNVDELYDQFAVYDASEQFVEYALLVETAPGKYKAIEN